MTDKEDRATEKQIAYLRRLGAPITDEQAANLTKKLTSIMIDGMKDDRPVAVPTYYGRH